MYKLSLIYSIILFTCNKSAKGLTLSPCGEDQVLEIEEDKSQTICFCKADLLYDVVEWSLMADSQVYSLGQCGRASLPCTSNIPSVFTLYVESDYITKVIINTTDMSPNYFPHNTSIGCKLSTEVEVKCFIDYIVAVEDVICHVRYDTGIIPWRVNAKCTIRRVYSSLHRYSCQLYQVQKEAIEIGQTARMTISPSEKHYASGFCKMSAPLSNTSGKFAYNVIISPGRKNIRANFTGEESTIRVPTSPPTHTCNEYIMEGATSVCTCTGDLGMPPGSIHWNSSGTSILTLSNARRTQSGTVYSCYTSWNGRYVQSVSYTLQVAYGPLSTELSGPEMPFDANGEVNATFLCKSSDVKPDPNITWFRRPSGVVINRGAAYSFPPTKDDDGAVIECETKNTITSRTTRARITIVLNYPPTSDPMISTISTPGSDDGSLYEGDSLTLTCEVTGGKPVNATVLVFRCGNKENLEGNSDKKSVRSQIRFQSISQVNHGEVCSCRTRWKNTNWYTRTSTKTLSVITRPGVPEISNTTADYPFIAGLSINGTLTCKSVIPFGTEAAYLWSSTAGGKPTGRGDGLLVFENVTKQQNGLSVGCSVRTKFTDNRQRVDDATFKLEVYYHPVIRVDDGSENQCQRINNSSSCAVWEGQKIHLHCLANGNPTPLRVTWATTRNSSLYIARANRIRDNGRFHCTAVTGILTNNRPPLNATQEFIVVVKYPSLILQFGFDNRTNITANEMDVVALTCYAVGKPSPKMQIKKMTNRIVLASAPQGRLSIDDETTEVRHTFNMTRCDDTGRYACEVDSLMEAEKHAFAELYVKCAPRLLYSSEISKMTKHVIFTNNPTALSFVVVAFPLPSTPTVMFWKEINDNFSSEATDAVQLKCQPLIELYQTNCTITINQELSVETGNYSAIFVNELGRVEYRFEVQLNGNNPDILRSYPPIGAYIGGAFGAGIFILAISVGVIVFLKHRRKQECLRRKSPTRNLPKCDHYENECFRNELRDEDNRNSIKSTKKTNPDGLVYAEIQFTPNKQMEAKKYTEEVIYTEIHFTTNEEMKRKKNTEEVIYTEVKFTAK